MAVVNPNVFEADLIEAQYREKMWLSVGECSWVLGVSPNEFYKIAKTYNLKENTFLQKSKKWRSKDVFLLRMEVIGC